jgi:Epoxide hydrolase N terminus
MAPARKAVARQRWGAEADRSIPSAAMPVHREREQILCPAKLIRPFRIDVPEEEEIAELRRRIAATRWPERETVTDDSQGVRLAMMQELARYWETDYDWRKCEGNLNALPNFVAAYPARRPHTRGTGRCPGPGHRATGRPTL